MYVVSAQNNVSTAKKGTREIEIRHKINSYSEHSTKIQIKQNNEPIILIPSQPVFALSP
jgi:hypothetical protein